MRKIIDWFGKTLNNTWLSIFITEFFHLFDNTKLGYSAKKTTAIVFLICVVKMHIDYCEFAIATSNFDLFPTILGVDISTILVLFGINEYSKGKAKKNQQQDAEEPETKKELKDE